MTTRRRLLQATVTAIADAGLTLATVDGHTLHAAVDGGRVQVGETLTLGARSEELRL